MTPNLSGLKVEYALAMIYSSEAGRREATIGFDVGQGTQDLGFRGEVPVLFNIRPAIPVTLRVRDHDGTPTVAHFTFVDRSGHVHPPQAKRIAPDLFFQRQIYRGDGGVVMLPPGRIRVTYGRGPEYRLVSRDLTVPDRGETIVRRPPRAMDRPVQPTASIAATTISTPPAVPHYTDPTQGVSPKDMFLQVKGEGLNVGCVLTWGPCYDFQRRFFEPRPDGLSEPRTVIKYDVEVSGFGSQALGHVCLLEPPRPDLSRLRWDRDERLADMDHARAALGQGPGCGDGLRPLGLGARGQPEGRHPTPVVGPRPRLRRLPHSRRGRPGPPSRPISRPPMRTATACSPVPSSKSAHEKAAETPPEPREPRDERGRRDGGRRHGADGRVRLHERDGHAADRRMEHVVPPARFAGSRSRSAARPTSPA